MKSVEVIDQGKIMGFNTYENILTHEKTNDADDRESDFYNVTVNFVVRRMPMFEAKQAHEKFIQLKHSDNFEDGSLT